MSGTTSNQSIAFGRYEPEGIYLSAPISTPVRILQQWGDNPEFYANYTYNGIQLKGYMGLGFDTPEGTPILAVDRGRVTEISMDPGGFERYVKIEHRWGETLYACLRTIAVESGQAIQQGELVGRSGRIPAAQQRRFHFGLRIIPYNRFDGWGGFTDPLPFMDPQLIGTTIEDASSERSDSAQWVPLPMPVEKPGMRRP